MALALIATGCSFFGGGPTDGGDVDPLRPLTPKRSLTTSGTQLAKGATLARTAPRYHVEASINPASGKVQGTVWASIPVGADASKMRFRFFAGLPSFKARPSIGPALVEGEPREITRRHSIATIALPADHPERVRVNFPFSYKLRKSTTSEGLLSSLGGGMSPAEIGLLSRHEKVVNLGHWLPLWIPDGRSHDPKPDGFGDIGNFPPALFSLELSVPTSWQVITGGVRVGEETQDGRRTVRVEGFGLRSLVGSVVRGYTSTKRDVGGTTVRVYGPASARGEMSAILETAAASLRILEDAFGTYPWRELDVIAAPLGTGVGGMEWSGAIWIETGVFSGQLLGGLGGGNGQGGSPFGGLLGEGGDGQAGGGLLGGLLGGSMGKRLQNVRAWTVAHEVGHQWWHIIVGNDSVRAPVVDEPLAQYSACLVMRRIQQGSSGKVCDRQIAISYTQMRMFGASDAPALQPSDQFASSMQYSGVIYGKAPYLYMTLEKKYGQQAVVEALREVSGAHAFEMITPAQLRQTLTATMGDGSGVRQVWRHWLAETHGDEDLDTSLGSGGPGGGLLGGLLDNLQGGSGGQDTGGGLFGGLLDDLQGGSGGQGGDGGQQDMQKLLDELLKDLNKSGQS